MGFVLKFFFRFESCLFHWRSRSHRFLDFDCPSKSCQLTEIGVSSYRSGRRGIKACSIDVSDIDLVSENTLDLCHWKQVRFFRIVGLSFRVREQFDHARSCMNRKLKTFKSRQSLEFKSDFRFLPVHLLACSSVVYLNVY